ncbi:DsbA family protein [Paraurantiacibacter namhicola]|uniref:DSBA-like thioredoxin domain protein n=1 Tax=Paraurantiacibacter namhicola TaxID=645517 RepID=A0A1C7D5T3_9SPHN|nr:DsbA family protein [Paraurantiacibacter namhicola]ANU06820.1 DSBA-like thioredoxin domain protein [Paraurantiacibacter namhicola]
MRWLATILVSLLAGFAGAGLWQVSGLGDTAVRSAIMAQPEIVPDAIEQWQRDEAAKRVAKYTEQIETPWPGAVLGNPEGSVTLVEFSDYGCGYCRQSVADVEALIAANPDLRVVIRELPIFGENSEAAARMALAAAEQGKYREFHLAMFEAGQPGPATIAAAARAAGLDMARAEADIASGRFDPHLKANAFMANELGLRGTPGFIVGDALFDGAVGEQRLGEAIVNVRDAAGAS